jgi:transcription elongation factor Elf1
MSGALFNCDICGGSMVKKGVMDSNNTRFLVFECEECESRKQVASGFTQIMFR